MNLHHWLGSMSLITSALLVVTVTTAQDVPAPQLLDLPKLDSKAGKLDDGIQVENRGPVHEAFANPGSPVRGKEGVFADKAPPPPVPELPPEEKPSGNNVQWIPGYWQWDIEKKDFIWVSGFYRNVPPGRAWQAGEWKVENGQNRYIPGFWKPSTGGISRTDLPEPPRSVENGPNVPAPHAGALWIPGRWVHRDENYVWQPGYWGEVEQNMMWTPGQYNYTGNGYCWVPGYWDYPLEERGLLYAPVYFTQPLWLNAGWRFCPSFGISIGFGGGWAWGYGGFYDSLFIGPGWGGFWFGNYFGPGWWGCGYRPWCWNGGSGHCNPVYNHYCWANRNNPNWNKGMQNNYAARNMGALPGPGRHVGGPGQQAGNFNPSTMKAATNMANRFGGDKAGAQLADRVGKGQAIQQVNQSLKQTGSSNVVQPASQVLRNQNVANNIPAPTSLRGTQGSTLSASKMVDASNSARSAMLNQQIGGAIRNAPTGSINRGDLTRSMGNDRMTRSFDSIINNSRAMSGRSDSFTGSRSLDSRSFDGRTFDSRSFNPSTSGRSFSTNPGMGSMGPRSGFSGGSSMGGSRGGFGGGGMGGGMGGGRGGGGGGGRK